MKISTIKKLKNGKYKLLLANKEQILTYDSVILENNLLFNKEIDIDLLSKINIQNNYYDLYNKVIKMVNTRLRSEKEILEFLIKNELSDSDISRMISDLKKQGIINDTKFVRAFIHDKVSFSNYGPLKIKKELLNYNIDQQIIDDELDLIDSNIFKEKQKKLILKKVSSNHKYSNNILKRRINDELYNLGFDNSDMDDFISNSDESIIEKDCLKLYEKLSKKYNGKDLKLKLQQKLYQKGFTKDLINSQLEKLNIN